LIKLSAGSDLSQTGLGHDRATYIGGALVGPGACAAAKATQNSVDFLNGAAFAPNSVPNPTSPGKTIPNPTPLGTFGNMGKNRLHGPGFYDWNVGLFKNFLFTERWRMQFRAEFFNVFNRANFNSPNTSLNNLTTFGTITSANDPRIGPLALKLLVLCKNLENLAFFAAFGRSSNWLARAAVAVGMWKPAFCAGFQAPRDLG
jgi:hypothetical protein